ncbi:MAG: transposase [bacterium]
MARGIERRKIFRDDEDYKRFLDFLEKFSLRHNVWIYAYALLPSHFHVLVGTPDANLSAFMHALKSSYVNYFNIRTHRAGRLFQDRFRAHVVEKETYLLELHRHVHLNPVRAGLVKRPEKWKWSSYAEFICPRSREHGSAEGREGNLQKQETWKGDRQPLLNI